MEPLSPIEKQVPSTIKLFPMKVFWLTSCFWIGFSTFLLGQYYYGGSAVTTGFGEIGVVASQNNYHSAYFQNPALLARNNHDFDFFMNFAPTIQGRRSLSGGFMSNFNKNAIGVGIEYISTENAGAYSLIPLLYARNLYHSENTSISIGSNLNIYNEDIKSAGFVGVITEEVSFISGGLGIDAYQVARLSEQQALRFNIAFSMNNIGPDTKSSFNNEVLVRNYYKMGFMTDWKYTISKYKSLVVAMGFQFNRNPRFSPNLTPNTSHLGNEISYFWEEDKFVTLRGGFVWNIYDTFIQQRNYSIGATISYKGLHLNFTIVPEENKSISKVIYSCIGFRVNFITEKYRQVPHTLETQQLKW